MSLIKLPIFGSVVSNADPADLQKQLSPASANFNTSTPGILRLRDGATLNFIDGTRGINSIFLWSHPDLENGYEFLGYCNRRGILFRLNADLTNFSNLDSYDGVIPMGSDNSSSSTFGYSTDWVKTLYGTIPKTISFTALGSSVLLNMGLDQDSLLMSRIKDRKIFGAKFTIPTGTYLNRAIPSYPQTFIVSVSSNTDSGLLPDGTYRYNASPIFNGVNELPLNPDLSVSSGALIGGDPQQVKISVELDKANMPRNMTGIKIYRAPVSVGVPLSYRNIKQINFRAPKGANEQAIVSVSDADDTVSTGLNSRYAIFSPNSTFFPMNTLIYQINAQQSGGERIGYYSKSSSGVYTDVDESNVFISLFAERPDQLGDKIVINDEDHYFSVSSPFSQSSNEDTLAQDLSLADWDDLFATGWGSKLLYSMTTHDEAYEHAYNSQNGWENMDGVYLWVKCTYDRSTSASNVGLQTEGEKSFYFSNCYMGTNKLYFKEDLFAEPNTHLGASVEVDTTDDGTTNYTMTMADHGTNWLSILDDSSTGWLTSTLQTSPSNGSATIVSGDTIRVTLDDAVDYTIATNVVTVDYLDKGDIDKSMPPLSSKTKFDVRWKYSAYHGGRLFVANVILEPRDEHEEHDDMILFSESGMPSIIPIANYIRLRDPQGGGIQGLKSMGDSLAVFMDYGLYRLRIPTSDPKSYQVVESNENVGCVAPKSIVKVEDYMYFCGRGNIYKLDAMFRVKDIGDAILDTYLANPDLKNSIAQYDSLNEVVLFRFGNDKRIVWEYNIRSDEWNRSSYQGRVSSMVAGEDGQTYFMDNTHLVLDRADGSSNDDDTSDDPDDPCDPSFDFDQGYQDSSWNDLIEVYDSMEDVSDKLGATNYFNVATTVDSSAVEWKSGADIESSIKVGMTVSGYGIDSAYTVTVTGVDAGDSYNNIPPSFAISRPATESAVSPTPGFSSMWFYGHNDSTTFYGNRRTGTAFFNNHKDYVLLKEDDFSSSNLKLEHGWLYVPQVNSVDVNYSYVALEILDDNCNLFEVTGSNRPFVQCKLKMLDSSHWNTGLITGTTRFMPVYNYITPTDENGDENYPVPGSEVYAFFLQAELHKLIEQTEDGNVYEPYILGDFQTWELNTGSPDDPVVVTNTAKSRTIIIKAQSNNTPCLKADFEYGYNSWYIYWTDILWWRKYADFNVEHADTGTGSGTGGCTDPLATNYDATVNYDDGSCVFEDTTVDPPPSEATVIASDPDDDDNLYWADNLIHDSPGDRANFFTWLGAQSQDPGDIHVSDEGTIIMDIMKNPGNHSPATLMFRKYKVWGYVSDQAKYKPLKMTGTGVYGVPYIYIYWLLSVDCNAGDVPCVSYGEGNDLPTLTQTFTTGDEPFGSFPEIFLMSSSTSFPNSEDTAYAQMAHPSGYTPHYDQVG